jgi:hypothetical protein
LPVPGKGIFQDGERERRKIKNKIVKGKYK